MEGLQKNRIKSVNIVFLVTILISVIVPFLPLDFLNDSMALQMVFSQLLLALPSVVYMVINRLPYGETVRFRKMKFADMALSILFGILIQPAITLINALSMVFAKNITGTAILNLSEQVPFLGALVLMAVMPAIMEETVYRGVFYNEYSKVNLWKAALLSGLLFGVMHGNFNQFCYAATMGIVFAMLIEATGSILSTMLVHFWTNAGSIVMFYLYPKLYEFAQSFYNMYKEYGYESMAAVLEASFGDMTQPASEWLRQLMESSANLNLTIPQVLGLYGPQAVIMGILAFLVYKKLATRSGNWYRICAAFKKQPKHQNEETVQVELELEPKQRLMTIPLWIGLVVGIAFMVLYEILLRM